MRVAFLTLGDRDVASSRIRAHVLAERLNSIGIRSWARVGSDRMALVNLFWGRKYDVCVIQKWVPPVVVLWLIRARSSVLVYDCDDGIYLDVSVHPPGDRRIARRNQARLRHLLRAVDRLTVSTERMADDFREMEPSTPILVFAGPRPDRTEDGDVSRRRGIVWLGSPATQSYLWGMYASLAPCIDRYGLVAVGATDAHDRPAVVCEKWSIETQTRVLAKARIGLFVQPEGPWESRKSGYKLLEYVANGVIPVAEDNMAAREILGEDYEFLVPSGAWADALDRACSLSDSEARECLAALTDRTERFSYSETVHRWVDFVEDGKPQKLRANKMRLL